MTEDERLLTVQEQACALRRFGSGAAFGEERGCALYGVGDPGDETGGLRQRIPHGPDSVARGGS
jgi:hypothetical protein